MNTPGFWKTKNFISVSLLPISLIWLLASWLRHKLQKPERVNAYVICVGNAVVGGGGKTPVALALGEMMREAGKSAYFISRGYGANVSKPILVNSEIHSAADVGDEPLMLASCLPTVVCKDRVRAARVAVSQGAEIIIMDDGMQNPSLFKNLNILVTKGNQPFGNGLIMPAGPLREPVQTALSRADVVIGIDQHIPPAGQLDYFKAKTKLSFAHAKPEKCIAFAGIAAPEYFRKSLEAAGIVVEKFIAFADHRPYKPRDMHMLDGLVARHQVKLVTTRKDAMRLPKTFPVMIADQQLIWDDKNPIQPWLYAKVAQG